MWFVRTNTAAYYFEEVERNPYHETTEPLDPGVYDKLFDAMSSWQQAQPLKAGTSPKMRYMDTKGSSASMIEATHAKCFLLVKIL